MVIRFQFHRLYHLSPYYDRYFVCTLNADPDSSPAYISFRGGRILGVLVKNCRPLAQDEIDDLIKTFELHSRTILTYGTIDEKFIRDYFCRHDLRGYTNMKFFNFKRLICSTRFSDGSLTKDNLCKMFRIRGVKKVHDGINDCILEWKLFKKIDGRKLIAYQYPAGWSIKALDPDYIVPVSYLATYSGLSRCFPRPTIKCETKEVFHLTVEGDYAVRFFGSSSGNVLEHLINVMLHVNDQSSANQNFLSTNYKKNAHIGVMPNQSIAVRMTLNHDGTVTATDKFYEELESQLNASIVGIKKHITPLIEFISSDIFNGEPILSQELSVDTELGILALCDLSNEHSVLEIKTTFWGVNLESFAEQIHYEAHGRRKFILAITWPERNKMDFTISEMSTFEEEKHSPKRLTNEEIDALLQAKGYTLIERFTNNDPFIIRCNVCGCEQKIRSTRIHSKKIVCPSCSANSPTKTIKKKKPKLSNEERRAMRAKKFALKVLEKSNGTLRVDENSYTAAKEKVTVTCLACNRSWATRADHLLARCYCSRCKASAVRETAD